VDGLKTSGGGAGAAAVNGADGGGNLAEQAVGAALRYRAYAMTVTMPPTKAR